MNKYNIIFIIKKENVLNVNLAMQKQSGLINNQSQVILH